VKATWALTVQLSSPGTIAPAASVNDGSPVPPVTMPSQVVTAADARLMPAGRSTVKSSVSTESSGPGLPSVKVSVALPDTSTTAGENSAETAIGSSGTGALGSTLTV